MPSPKESRKTPPENAYALAVSGRETFQRLFSLATAGLDEEMAALGFPGIGASEVNARMTGLAINPGENEPRGETMWVQHLPEMMAIVAFLREPISKALVQVASGEFFKVALPKIGKLFTVKSRPSDVIPFPIQFRPAMYFESEKVLVTVIMTLNSADDFKVAETLVPLAYERAVDFLERNGRTASYLTYRIADGRLNSFPAISESPMGE